MSCMELVASDSYGKESICNMQDDIEYSAKNSLPSSVSRNKNKWLNSSIGLSTSSDKLSLYTFANEPLAPSKEKTITNACESSDVNINGHDLQEMHNITTIVKKDKKKELDTLFDPSNSCGTENVEECLLDLDDYLDKMDVDCEKPISLVVPNGISSLGKKNSSKMNSKFERGLKTRNTISCNFNKVPEDEFALSYLACNTQKDKYRYNQPQNKRRTEAINRLELDVEEEPQSSEISDKSESSQNSTDLNLKIERPNMNSLEVLTNDQIFQNLIEQHGHMETERPRQFGRRAERLSTQSAHLNNTIQRFSHVNYDNLRQVSAPGLTDVSIRQSNYQNDILHVGSDGSTTRTSCNTTPISIQSSTDSGESLVISDTIGEPNISVNEENNQQSTQPLDSEIVNASVKSDFNTFWPYNFSRTLALTSCTLGLFNCSRFAVLTINYGGSFLIQFLILSIIFGIPFLWLQMCLGAKIEAGPISMWKISPICIGIGISIILVQYCITIYSSVTIVWLIIYIRDIIVKKSYPWLDSIYPIITRKSGHIYTNLTEVIPDYFNVNVLQRVQLFQLSDQHGVQFHINNQLAFYLTILWAAVFLILCKGLKSFGKVILLLGILPILMLAVVVVKLLCVVDFVKLQEVFSSSEFDDFLVNSKTWIAAAQETFLTWGIFGASIVSISSRTYKKPSKFALRTDAVLVVLITLIGLCLSALVGICSIQIINESGYAYVPGSYETPENYSSIFSLKTSRASHLIAYPTKYIPHYSTLVGEVYRRHTDVKSVSGYQVLRFITELLPAAMTLSTEKISWIWTSILLTVFLIFGVSQLCVLWKPVSCALGNSTSAVLMTCITGLLLSIPFTTEIGISLLYYMDILMGGAWFIPILWTAEIFGVFLIRGRPYNGEDLVKDLKMSGSMSAFLALSWSVILPIGLIILAIIGYKTSLSSQLYNWKEKSYFYFWSRKVGALTQIGFLLLIPISAIVQIYRYLTSGPPDILDRIQMLYRPLGDVDNIERTSRTCRNINSRYYENNQNSTNERFQDDDPPKYTPPPSYTTATGARLAKILRQSLRRSIRRILGETERPILPIPAAFTPDETSFSISESIEFENRPLHNLLHDRSYSLGRKQMSKRKRLRRMNEGPLSAAPFYELNSNSRSSRTHNYRAYTAEDVITILRSSTLGHRSISRSVNLQNESSFRSIENLVQNAEPPNFSSAMNNEVGRDDSSL